MRGGYLHNSVLLDPIEDHFVRLGAQVHREFRTRSAQFLGFVDLFVVLGGQRIACEAELSPDRISRDVRKAVQLDADQLLIVVPHPRLVRAIHRRLRQAALGCDGPQTFVLPLGAALSHVRSCFPLFSNVIPEREGNRQPQTAREEDGQ